MNRRLPIEDTQPWYRQFWPWFLILLPASVVVAGISTLVIANRHADDLVVDEYYKDGLAINRQLEKKQRAGELGISAAALSFSEGGVTLQLTGTVDAQELRLFLSHPLESDRDFTMSLTRAAGDVWHGVLPQPVAPRWHWTLEPEPAGQGGWRLDGSVAAANFEDERID